jgi:hypothetical protein
VVVVSTGIISKKAKQKIKVRPSQELVQASTSVDAGTSKKEDGTNKELETDRTKLKLICFKLFQDLPQPKTSPSPQWLATRARCPF